MANMLLGGAAGANHCHAVTVRHDVNWKTEKQKYRDLI